MKAWTNQSIYDAVLNHLRKQGRASVAITRDGQTTDTCMYRGNGGTSCAVGCLIPDEIYAKYGRKIEGSSVLYAAGKHLGDALSLCGLTEEFYPLLDALQSAHDGPLVDAGLTKFEEEMQAVADNFNLSYRQLETQS